MRNYIGRSGQSGPGPGYNNNSEISKCPSGRKPLKIPLFIPILYGILNEIRTDSICNALF